MPPELQSPEIQAFANGFPIALMHIGVTVAILNRAGYASPIRTPRGRDILAACGQLKSESEKLRASARRKQAAETGEAIA